MEAEWIERGKDFIYDLPQCIANGDLLCVSVLIALIVVFLTIVLIASGGTNNRRSVLLVGLCDSGKTLLFSQLVHGKYANTHTSIKENKGVYNLPNNKEKNLTLVDLPGHERIRVHYTDEYKSSARAVLYVIDSSKFQADIRDVAECLYSLLTDQVLSANTTPFLIACNKQDLTMAKGRTVIKAQLEKEMNLLRVTRSGTLEGTSSASNNNTFLGKRNKDFSFKDCLPVIVEFVECSATKDGDLDEVSKWLVKVA